MGALQVGPYEAAVAQRGAQALVPEQPSHFIEPGAAAQPGSRRKVTERVRMQLAMIGQAGLAAEPVVDLNEVARLQRATLAVAEQECLGRGDQGAAPATS